MFLNFTDGSPKRSLWLGAQTGRHGDSHRSPERPSWRSTCGRPRRRCPRAGGADACPGSRQPGNWMPVTHPRRLRCSLGPGSGSVRNGGPRSPRPLRSRRLGSPLRPTTATKGRLAAWPFNDSRQRKCRFTSNTSGSEVAGTAACTRGRRAPATPRDVADRTGAKGPERAATDNMATAAANARPVTETTFRPPRQREEARAP